MVLLLRKLYLYFTKDPEAVHYFSGGRGGEDGVQLFPGGSKWYTYVLVTFKGECPDPLSPS